eukprot:3158406-Amphidinium_carterae.1
MRHDSGWRGTACDRGVSSHEDTSIPYVAGTERIKTTTGEEPRDEIGNYQTGTALACSQQ